MQHLSKMLSIRVLLLTGENHSYPIDQNPQKKQLLYVIEEDLEFPSLCSAYRMDQKRSLQCCQTHFVMWGFNKFGAENTQNSGSLAQNNGLDEYEKDIQDFLILSHHQAAPTFYPLILFPKRSSLTSHSLSASLTLLQHRMEARTWQVPLRQEHISLSFQM